MIKEKLTSYFNVVFEEALVDEIVKVGVYSKVRENELLLDLGDKFDKIPLILSGGSGLHGAKSEIRGVAEMDSEIIFIPVEKMDEWLAKYKSWRTFVIDSYNTRLSEMIEAIDTLAFKKMDERLFKYLTDKVKIMRSTTLTTTHQEIAQDLNTSRVVISRLLKQLENEQKIKLFRNKIEVLEY